MSTRRTLTSLLATLWMLAALPARADVPLEEDAAPTELDAGTPEGEVTGAGHTDAAISSEASTVEPAEPGYFTTDPAHAPWRGSGVSLRNAVTVPSFDKGSDLTYNPTYFLAFDARLRWYFLDRLYAQLGLGVRHELTDDDSTTYANESTLSDLTLRVAAPALVTIPGAEIAISPALALRFPTSKASQGQSLLTALTMEVAISRSFDLLEGLSVAYQFQGTRSFHRYTTSTLESPRIDGCVGVGGVCSSLLNTGVRNTDWRLTHVVSVGFSPLTWLGFSTNVGWISDHVRPGADDPRVSYTPQEPTDWRHYLLFGLEVDVRPLPGFQVAVGASTAAPQLAPDSSPYTPLLNRHTAVYVDLRLDVAPLIDALMPEEGD